MPQRGHEGISHCPSPPPALWVQGYLPPHMEVPFLRIEAALEKTCWALQPPAPFPGVAQQMFHWEAPQQGMKPSSLPYSQARGSLSPDTPLWLTGLGRPFRGTA